MAKQKKETGLVTKDVFDLAKMGQEGIPELLQTVKAKIATLTRGVKEKSSTDGKRIPGFPELESIDKVTILVQAYSSVDGKAKAYEAAAKAMEVNISKFPFKIDGCSAQQWKDAIKSHTSILVNKTELDKLKQIQKTLEENLSQEEKLKNDLAKIAGMLGDDSPLE